MMYRYHNNPNYPRDTQNRIFLPGIVSLKPGKKVEFSKNFIDI